VLVLGTRHHPTAVDGILTGGDAGDRPLRLVQRVVVDPGDDDSTVSRGRGLWGEVRIDPTWVERIPRHQQHAPHCA
jgi:hypothetical protein